MDVDSDPMLEDLQILLSAAMLASACAQAKCNVSGELHRWYADIVHLDNAPHQCPACQWGDGYPRRFLSLETLYQGHRGEVVASLSAWFDHLHAVVPQVSSGVGGGSAPLNADSPTSAPTGDGPTIDGPVVAGWDRVGSAPSD